MKFRYIVIGKQGWRQEHRWVFQDGRDALHFAQTLLGAHETENEEEDGPYEVAIEVYMEDDDEGVN